MKEPSIPELVRRITEALVEEPSDIEISEVRATQVTIIEIKVAKKDLGRLIGRRGSSIDAIRTIVNCASAKISKRYLVEVTND